MVLVALLVHVLVNISAILKFLVDFAEAVLLARPQRARHGLLDESPAAPRFRPRLPWPRNLGIPAAGGGFVLPLGSTMCMNGTALFEGITVIFLAQVFGVELPPSDGGGHGHGRADGGRRCGRARVVHPAAGGVLTMFGVPAEGIAIVLGVDRILDMSRTTVNVCGDLTATAFVAKSEGVWDASMVPSIAAIERPAHAA